jgi:hypothetical protein
MTEGVTDTRFKVGAWFLSEDRDTPYDGSTKVVNLHDERTRIRVPLLTLDARFTQQFGVQAAITLPDVTRTATNFSETFQGLGDTSLIGWYRLRPIHRWYVVVNVGTSLPTGKTERPRFRPELQAGDLVPLSRLQRGSGTVDPLFGLSVTRSALGVTLFGSVAARTPVSENSTGLRTGASSEVNTGIAREVGTHRVSAFGRLGWLHREQDAFEGTPVLVGGGNWLYLTPGVAVQVGKGINVQAEVKVPVYRSLANRQLDSSAIFQFGVSRGF